ncbi:MAG: transcription antitermination factor NusB [Vampirovibrionales bacterium]|nr:transcription antitermination factor NusB [Vampirovibrionales bacterium]
MRAKATTQTPRAVAFNVLLPLERSALKATLEPDHKREKLDQSLERLFPNFNAPQDKAFVSALTYGIARRWFQLETLILWGLNRFEKFDNEFSASKTKQLLKPLDVKARLLLRMGFFQLLWLNSVPDYAAIASTLELAELVKLDTRNKKQLHAVLSAAAEPERLARLKKAISVVPLWPKPFSQHLSGIFSEEQLLEMKAASEQAPDGFWVRVNTIKISPEEYALTLKSEAIEFSASEPLGECIRIQKFSGSPAQLPGFEEGLVYVQDLSSALVTQWLLPESGQMILDLCAAPGSKTTHIAARIKNDGRVLAVENNPRRSERLRENCKRLGADCVEIITADALVWEPETTLRFDRILVDAPCSGIGTLHHQPDTLVQWRKAEATQYAKIQLEILTRASQWLKPDGRLLYSTCSLDPLENQNVIQSFLASNPEWRWVETHQQPITSTQDGFFGAVLTKK